jgi:hypothetical protein
MNQDCINAEAMIGDYVSKLKRVFSQMPVMGETDPASREAIRQIGQQIYDSGIYQTAGKRINHMR